MSIDWTKPLELMDGTPVVLPGFVDDEFGGTNPDCDGDYWVRRADGGMIASADGVSLYWQMCVHPNGEEEGEGVVVVRNRTGGAA